MSEPKHYVSAAVIVRNEQGDILLIKGPRRGWEMPGGKLEPGESLQNAAIREVKEESGIDVEIECFCGIFQNVEKGTLGTLFLGKAVGGEPTPNPEALEVGFFPLEKVRTMVTWSNFLERIEYCLRPELQPFVVSY